MLTTKKLWCAVAFTGPLLTVGTTGYAQTGTISDAARAAIDQVAAVQQVSLEPVATGSGTGAASVNFQVKNLSRKTIYAIGYSITVKYADGSTQAAKSHTLDLLPVYFERIYFEKSLTPGAPRSALPPLLRPNETFADAGMATSFPLDRSQSLPVLAQPTIDMLIFEDGAALGDPKSIQRIRNSRQSKIDQISTLIEDLEDVVKADNPQQASVARVEDSLAGRLKDKNGNPAGFTIITDSEGKLIDRVDWRQARVALLTGVLVNTNGDKSRINVRIAKNEQYLQMLKAQPAITEVVR